MHINYQFKKHVAFCVMIATLGTLSGCGGVEDRPATYPVSGTVMYNGKTIAGATVSFWCDGASRAATGVTDAEGKFKLSMFDANDGALAGTHTITVSKIEGAAAPTVSPEEVMNDPSALASMGANQGKAKSGPKSVVPTKYGDRKMTSLKETVSADAENNFVLQLAD